MAENVESKQVECQPIANTNAPNAEEEAFNRFKEYADNAKSEYEKIYREMVNEINVEHLQPFANILLKEEKTILKDQEQLVEKIRKTLLQELLSSLDNFWTSNNITVALTTLEMCKDKYKDYPDKDWEVSKKTPVERIRPIRMRLRDSSIRFLQAQLKRQCAEIEEVLQGTMQQRSRIQNIEQNRVYLLKVMEEYKKKFEDAKSEILRLQLKVLNMNDIPKADEQAPEDT